MLTSFGTATLLTILLLPTLASAEKPMGYIDGVSASGWVYGWSFDAAIPHEANRVSFFIDGEGHENWIGSTKTKQVRQDINRSYKITGNHGFNFPIPKKWFDGKPHQLYVYFHPVSNQHKPQIGRAHV